MNEMLISALAGLLAGLIGGMGMGGGGVLVLFLVLFLDMPQIQAQGINLIFFIPIAIVSLIIHCKNKLVKWKLAFPMILTGLAGVACGMLILDRIPDDILRKAFAVLIFFIGSKSLITAIKEKKQDSPSS